MPVGRALAQDALELLVLVPPLDRRARPHHLKLLAVLGGNLHNARRVLRPNTLFVLPVLRHSPFGDGQTAVAHLTSIEIDVRLWTGTDLGH